MNTKPIREYSTNALIDIAKHLEFSDWDKQPVAKIVTYESFDDIDTTLRIIFDAIEFIGFNGQERDLATCSGLAQIGKKLLPTNELGFLDSLLIKKEGNKEVFTKIENL
ncbi:hypothetical protein ACUXZJ_05940 [Flavobacterium sp. TN-1]